MSPPEPRSTGELADRLQRPGSVAQVLPRLTLPHLQVAEALAALEKAKAATRTTVVHVETDLYGPNPPGHGWWDVPVSQTSALDTTRTAYATYAARKQTQRPYL